MYSNTVSDKFIMTREAYFIDHLIVCYIIFRSNCSNLPILVGLQIYDIKVWCFISV